MNDFETEDVEAVVFDLDETLLDAQKGLEAAQKAVAGKIFRRYSEDLDFGLNELVKKLSDFDDEKNLNREYDRDEWWPTFLELVGLEEELNPELVGELTDIYWDHYEISAVPYPDAESVLEYLDSKGYKLGMLTDTDDFGDSKIDRIEPLKFFDLFDSIVVAGEDTEEPKPDPECFRMIAEDLGVEPGHVCMVGDKPFTDIKGANSVGMKTVMVKRRDWNEGEDADLQVSSLEELKEIL